MCAEAACICTNTCKYANDGSCEDGGPGKHYSICTLGSDCADCGPSSRTALNKGGSCAGMGSASGSVSSCKCTGPSKPCQSKASGNCYAKGSSGSCYSWTTECKPASSAAGCKCTNTCTYANDGSCDDGGAGKDYSLCPLGSDCADCGPSVRAMRQMGSVCPVFSKVPNKFCSSKLASTYSSQSAAEAACATLSNCSAIYDQGCDGTDGTGATRLSLCHSAALLQFSSQGSCVIIKYKTRAAVPTHAPTRYRNNTCAKGTHFVRFSSNSGSQSQICKTCEPGRYAPRVGLSACRLCALGHDYQPNNGRTSCIALSKSVPCVAGTYATRSTVCYACPQGRITTKVNQSRCGPCPHGFTNEGAGMTTCPIRLAGVVSPEPKGATPPFRAVSSSIANLTGPTDGATWMSDWADVNRDGHLDVYKTKVGKTKHNELWLGDGRGGFRAAAGGAATASPRTSHATAFGDVDEDGCVAVYPLPHTHCTHTHTHTVTHTHID